MKFRLQEMVELLTVKKILLRYLIGSAFLYMLIISILNVRHASLISITVFILLGTISFLSLPVSCIPLSLFFDKIEDLFHGINDFLSNDKIYIYRTSFFMEVFKWFSRLVWKTFRFIFTFGISFYFFFIFAPLGYLLRYRTI